MQPLNWRVMPKFEKEKSVFVLLIDLSVTYSSDLSFCHVAGNIAVLRLYMKYFVAFGCLSLIQMFSNVVTAVLFPYNFKIPSERFSTVVTSH